MEFWTAIVLIVGLSIVGGLISQFIRARNGEEIGEESLMKDLGLGMGDEGGMSKKQLKPYLDRIDQLEDRVKVLERIATDKGRSLADEIDNL